MEQLTDGTKIASARDTEDTNAEMIYSRGGNTDSLLSGQEHKGEAVYLLNNSQVPPWVPSAFLEIAKKRLCGWRAGLTLAFTADILVLLLALGFTIGAAIGFERGGDYMESIIVKGSCSRTKSVGTWLHLLINVLSTVLLSTSSFTMQCVASPTRQEVDKAHDENNFLTIGVPSLRNLIYIARPRTILYALILLTSLPLHLLANSAIYSSLATSSYGMFQVDRHFVDVSIEHMASKYAYTVHSYNGNLDLSVSFGWNTTTVLKDMLPQFERLENDECIRAYSSPILAGRRHVVVVSTLDFARWRYDDTAETYNTNFILDVNYQSIEFCPDCRSYLNYTDPTVWTCAFVSPKQTNSNLDVKSCDTSLAAQRAADFSLNSYPVDYCLSERIEESCELRANIWILTTVIMCAAIKSAVVFIVLRTLPSQILATLGDAVSSFLVTPDSYTQQCSLLDQEDVKQRHQGNRATRYRSLHSSTPRWHLGRPFLKHWKSWTLKAKWSEGPPGRSWARMMVMFLCVLIFCLALLIAGVRRLKQITSAEARFEYSKPPTSIQGLWDMGFGTLNVNALLQLPGSSSEGGIIHKSLLVNAPQLVLSLCYFNYNQVWTHMLGAREWAQFGRKRQTLRVSQPQGLQRSKYFLTIPYRFAIPLQTTSVLLHWLLSQSFFLARLNVYSGEPFVNTAPSTINTIGYSLIALMSLILLWGILLITVWATGIFTKLKSPMPIVNGMSLAIAAACHAPASEMDTSLRPLMWGVVDLQEEDGMKHCSFSAEEVYSPEHLPLEDIPRHADQAKQTMTEIA